MKKKTVIKTVIAAILILITAALVIVFGVFSSEQRNLISFMMFSSNSYDDYQEYQVIERNETIVSPLSFEPDAVQPSEEDLNTNITVIAGRMGNESSNMIKQASVVPNGIENYTGWHLIADEGFEEGENTFGPSPLSYLTSGAAANLHTQILRAAEVMDVQLEYIRVEVLNKFHWEEMLSPEGTGHLGQTYTNIIIESDESEQTIQTVIDAALNSWTAKEAFENETVIAPVLIINSDSSDSYETVAGTSLSDESYDNGFRISHITDGPEKSDYIEQVLEEDEDMSFSAMSNLVFEILAVTESAHDVESPYLKKITVSFNTPSSETWEIYSDEFDSGIPKAPTSLEYLTAGTALCLTSQLTLVSAMMDLDFTDFWVEQQIDYRLENSKSPEMTGYADTVHTYVVVQSDESKQRLDEFFNKSLSLCFAGEAFKGETEMYIDTYLNGNRID